MNENQAGTPNPINQTPVANANSVNSLAPEGRPMEKAIPTTPEPIKKKKTGLVIGIIALIVLVVGAIVAIIIIMGMNKTDPVSRAMKKIMDGEAPSTVAIDGNINIVPNDENSPISSFNIELKSNETSNFAINDSKAIVTADIRNVGSFTVEFDEIYAGNGDLYFKIDGAKEAIENSGILYLLSLTNQMPNEIDCGDDEYCQTGEIEDLVYDDYEAVELDEEELILDDGGQAVFAEDTLGYFSSLLDMVEIIDGQWLKISLDELGLISGGIVEDSNISCVTNLVSEINTSSNSASELYKKNPFIVSSDENISLPSKNYPVYKISIDSENFANYVNSIKNANLSSELYNCLGWNNNVQINEEDVEKIVDVMPTIYTEIDNDDNFSRIYLVSDLGDDEGTVTIDLGFSYPANINVSEPLEYKDFSNVLTEIFSSMYDV